MDDPTRQPPATAATATRKRGRPSRYTPEVHRRLVEGIRLGLTSALAAGYAGIAVSTLDGWRKDARENPRSKYSDLVADLIRAESEAAAVLAGRVFASSRTDWKAASWLLERRYGYVRGGTAAADSVGGVEGASGLRLDAADVVAGGRVEILRGLLLTLRRSLDAAIEDRSHQAVAALTRQLSETVRDLAVAASETGDPIEAEAEDAFRDRLEVAAEDLPEAHLRIFAEVWLRRHRLRAEPDHDRIRIDAARYGRVEGSEAPEVVDADDLDDFVAP